jgi:purine-binding chemotaxis protein CheW
MLSPSSSRLRRFRIHQAIATQQVLVFALRQHQFALPAQVVNKVVVLNNFYRSIPNSTAGFTLYQGEEIPVIDLQQRIFGQPADAATPLEVEAIAQPAYLVVVQNLQNELVGLPLDLQPRLRRIPESAFSPLSSTFLAEGHFRCTTALIMPTQDEPPIFLLNLSQLLQVVVAD